jgi:hypothetical protein
MEDSHQLTESSLCDKCTKELKSRLSHGSVTVLEYHVEAAARAAHFSFYRVYKAIDGLRALVEKMKNE